MQINFFTVYFYYSTRFSIACFFSKDKIIDKSLAVTQLLSFFSILNDKFTFIINLSNTDAILPIWTKKIDS